MDKTKSKSFAGDLTQDVPTQRWVLLNQAIEYLALEGMNYQGGPVDDEENHRFQVALEEIFDKDQAEARRTAKAGAALGLNFWDLLRWWPVIQAFAEFINSVGTLAPGQSVSSPELPFPIPFSGKSYILSLNVKAA